MIKWLIGYIVIGLGVIGAMRVLDSKICTRIDGVRVADMDKMNFAGAIILWPWIVYQVLSKTEG